MVPPCCGREPPKKNSITSSVGIRLRISRWDNRVCVLWELVAPKNFFPFPFPRTSITKMGLLPGPTHPQKIHHETCGHPLPYIMTGSSRRGSLGACRPMLSIFSYLHPSPPKANIAPLFTPASLMSSVCSQFGSISERWR